VRVEVQTKHNPFKMALPWGVCVWIALAVIHVQRSTEPAAYVLGQTFAWGMIAGAAAAVLALVSRFEWRWWFYPPVVLTIGFVFYGLSSLNDSPTSSGRSTTRMELTAPASFGALDGVDAANLDEMRTEIEDKMDRGTDGVESAVVGQYGPNGGRPTVAFFGINVAPDSRFDDEIDESPSRAVLNYLAGAGVDEGEYVETGRLGGAMRCAPVDQQGADYVCAWSTVGVLGVVTFLDEVSDIDEAAERALEFRELAESPR
jgi:hypothetical protein